MARNTKKEIKVEEKKATPEVKETPVQATPKKVRSNLENRSNGKFSLVRRNDNRIRIVSGGKTIGTIQVGTRKCSIHTATKDVFDVLEEEVRKTVTEVKMGPNSYKLSVDTDKVDATARAIFGECEELIIEEKKEEK